MIKWDWKFDIKYCLWYPEIKQSKIYLKIFQLKYHIILILDHSEFSTEMLSFFLFFPNKFIVLKTMKTLGKKP